MRSKRTGRTGIGESGEYRQLAAAILERALRDWYLTGFGDPTPMHLEVASLEGFGEDTDAELVAFLESDWVDYLCTACDLDVEVYLAALRRRPRTSEEYHSRTGSSLVGARGAQRVQEINRRRTRKGRDPQLREEDYE